MPPKSRSELEDQLRRLQQEVDETIRALQRADDAPAEEPVRGPARSSRRPVREVALESLEDLGWPVYTRELSLYMSARYGRSVEATRFGSLAADERASFTRGTTRTVWLCHGLTFDRGEAIRRLWARSDWPLEARIVTPTAGRVQHLRLTSRICQLAAEHEDAPDRLHFLAADLARDLPDTRVRRGEFALDAWRQTADRLLGSVEREDQERRRDAADRLAARLSDFHLLFGVPDVIAGADEAPERREAI